MESSAMHMDPAPLRPLVPRSAPDLLADARMQVPDLPDAHVPRPALVARLEESTGLPLVVVSSPAGTGKTTLVAEWAHVVARREALGWITFESGDADLWEPLDDCLARLGVNLSSWPGPTGGRAADPDWLTELTGALLRRSQPVTVVLDGYELLDDAVARDVDFLLRHTQGRLRLVMVGRVDPLLPLYRYRLEESVTELRIADLSFGYDETARLLEQLGLRLSRRATRQLTERTKGWVAGLRFAARTLAGRSDPEAQVETVVARSGDIHEYLLGEVLDAQTPSVRKLLLATCVPDVLFPGLLESLGGPKAPRLLADLARSTAFLENVPDQPGCFRYFPFFRDLLRAQLAYESPRSWAKQHRRAARWLRWHGLALESLTLLVRLGDWDGVAAQIVDDVLLGRVVLEGPWSGIGRIAADLPEDRQRADACLVRAAVALGRGDLGAAGEALTRSAESPVAQERAAAVALAVSVLAALLGGTVGCDEANERADDAELALALTPWRVPSASAAELDALVQLSTGVARLRRGDTTAARESLSTALAGAAAARYPTFRRACLGRLALVDAWDGRLTHAVRTASEALGHDTDHETGHETGYEAGQDDRWDGPAAIEDPAGPEAAQRAARTRRDVTVPALLALARVDLDRNHLDAAKRHVSQAVASGAAAEADPVCAAVTEEVLAALHVGSGHASAARARLESATATLLPADPWLADSLRVGVARLHLGAGHGNEAMAVLADVDPGHAELPIVAAATLLEGDDLDHARAALTDRGDGPLPLSVQVSRLLVEASLERRLGSSGRSRVLLDRALRLASREQLARPFREGSGSVRQLLSAHPQLLAEHEWLAQPRAGEPVLPGRRATAGAPRPAEAPATTRIVEQLTPKELEVLGHLEALLTTEEIADKMFVSVNTVRTHVRSILRKLGVTRRNAAVRTARELGILHG